MVRYTLQGYFEMRGDEVRSWVFIKYFGPGCCALCSREESLMEFHVFPRISPEGVDIVLDCLCGENTGKGLSLLKPLGTYILYGRFGKVKNRRLSRTLVFSKMHFEKVILS